MYPQLAMTDCEIEAALSLHGECTMDDRKLTVLAIDDDPADALVLRRHLERIPDWDVEMLHAPDSDSGRAAMAHRNIDLIFLDYMLGIETGLEALDAIRNGGDGPPVIMLTGQGNEEVAVEAMKAGAEDYIPKGNVSRITLTHSMRSALEKAALRRQVAFQHRQLVQLATTDELTGVYNRRYFTERLEEEFGRVERYGHRLCVLLLDLDHFKRVNDTYGHMTGDVVLSTVGQMLRKLVRSPDTVGRYGGEEFSILLTSTDLEGGRAVAERIRKSIASNAFAPMHRGQDFHITCSVGVAQFDGSGVNIRAFLDLCDQALYRAKAGGRNCVVAMPNGE
jgi:two-component system cell cycle response regulator